MTDTRNVPVSVMKKKFEKEAMESHNTIASVRVPQDGTFSSS